MSEEEGCLEDGSDVRTATGPRTCDLCGGDIATGTKYETWLWALEKGELRRIRAHRACEAVRQEISMDEWTGDIPLSSYFWDNHAERVGEDEGGVNGYRLPVEPLHGGFDDPELEAEWAVAWARIRTDG